MLSQLLSCKFFSLKHTCSFYGPFVINTVVLCLVLERLPPLLGLFHQLGYRVSHALSPLLGSLILSNHVSFIFIS